MKILMTGNLVFFPLNGDNTFVSKSDSSIKYMAGSLYGGIFPSEIYTLDEVKKAYPKINEVELSVSKEIELI